jgi:signal transduction histidine kinase
MAPMHVSFKRWWHSLWLTQAAIRVQDDEGQFMAAIWRLNFQRTSIMNAFIGVIVSVLLVVDLGNRHNGYWSIVPGFRYLFYNHVEMLVIVLLYALAGLAWDRRNRSERPGWMAPVMVAYIFCVTLSCTATGVIDQLISGQISMFIITMFTIATTVFFPLRFSLFMFPVNLAVFLIGSLVVLPSHSLIQGHIINVSVTTVVAWVLSRLLFDGRWRDFLNLQIIGQQKSDLEQSNSKLADEIEERKIVEKALQDSNEKLREMDILKTDFLNTVSHELRTPLTALIGFAKMIRSRQQRVFTAVADTDPAVVKAMDQIKGDVDIIISEGERMTHLIEDMLDISKMEVGKYEWRMQQLAVDQLVRHAFSATAFLFEQKGLASRLDISAVLPPLTGDHDRLLQVLINLLGNAVKFTERGHVNCTVRAIEQGGNGSHRPFIEIAISDTGRGIDPAQIPFLFGKFVQFPQEELDTLRGSGLGLAICKQIVERHGGRITASSQVGQGSTFTFWLPVDGPAV